MIFEVLIHSCRFAKLDQIVFSVPPFVLFNKPTTVEDPLFAVGAAEHPKKQTGFVDMVLFLL